MQGGFSYQHSVFQPYHPRRCASPRSAFKALRLRRGRFDYGPIRRLTIADRRAHSSSLTRFQGVWRAPPNAFRNGSTVRPPLRTGIEQSPGNLMTGAARAASVGHESCVASYARAVRRLRPHEHLPGQFEPPARRKPPPSYYSIPLGAPSCDVRHGGSGWSRTLVDRVQKPLGQDGLPATNSGDAPICGLASQLDSGSYAPASCRALRPE